MELIKLIRRTNYKHLASNTDLTLQDKYMFDLVHSRQEKGQRLKGAIIIIQINFFSAQCEYIGMISLSKKITDTI